MEQILRPKPHNMHSDDDNCMACISIMQLNFCTISIFISWSVLWQVFSLVDSALFQRRESSAKFSCYTAARHLMNPFVFCVCLHNDAFLSHKVLLCVHCTIIWNETTIRTYSFVCTYRKLSNHSPYSSLMRLRWYKKVGRRISLLKFDEQSSC